MKMPRYFPNQLPAGGRWLPVPLLLALAIVASAAVPPALPVGQRPDDRRLGNLRSTASEFPMQPVTDIRAWPSRREEIRTRVLLAAGLHPLPVRSPLNAIVYGKVERDDYTVERVIFESFPGHYVTGSLYRPKSPAQGSRAAVLSPYGHWRNGRFGFGGMDDGNKIQARCVQLARMGCVAFVYDMEGFCDSVQIGHASGPRPKDPGQPGYLLFSPQAELQGQTILGLQTWNSIRALDFMCSLPEVDSKRVGITGASSGATQTLMITAIDERIVASFPVCMVSAEVSQGGCPCESAPYLRINQGNVDLAAATAPRPLGICSANDHTKSFATDGDAEVRRLYVLLGHPENYEAHFRLEFNHNYNAANRQYMYDLMNQHLRLGLPGPITERDFSPLSENEATVWTAEHPKPAGNGVGDSHERMLTAAWAQTTKAAFDGMSSAERQRVIAEGVTTMVGRLPAAVGPVKWDQVNQASIGNCLVTTGTLTVTTHREQLPALFIHPQQGWNREVVIWLTDTGKDALFGSDGQPIAGVDALLRKGYAVASVDLFGQGEFVGSGSGLAIKSVRMVRAHMSAACFTFGYNPPLVVNRVHDVMSLVEFLRQEQGKRKAGHLGLVAIGREVGPVGLIARFMLGDRIKQAALDSQDFDFNTVDRLDDPMLVPGILRYGGMDALWLLNQPLATARIKGAGDVGRIFATARRN
ncbi:MAG: acetylxylan esterase [Verrucomicrobia bacterium]|nr:acetylxylan esterase [Verrucomicrobiota bacterium]